MNINNVQRNAFFLKNFQAQLLVLLTQTVLPHLPELVKYLQKYKLDAPIFLITSQDFLMDFAHDIPSCLKLSVIIFEYFSQGVRPISCKIGALDDTALNEKCN